MKLVILFFQAIICAFKDDFRIQEHGMFTSAIKKQTSVCCSISLYPLWYFKLGIMEKKERKAIIFLAYIITDVSCLTNRPFYMRTLSLRTIKTYPNYVIFKNCD